MFVRAGSRSGEHEARGGSGGVRSAEEVAWDGVRDEFEAVDRALSRFRDDSELTALNRLAGTGAVVDVSWRLREAVAIMHRAGRVTAGRFDPTVLGVLDSLASAARAWSVGPPMPRRRPGRTPQAGSGSTPLSSAPARSAPRNVRSTRVGSARAWPCAGPPGER